ncbi:MAG: M20/M25/M40 family metallo-hydrolase [Acidobacteria bacterium]|nr:M20/M25/M40 family metallo-hydrolase [Acidobacteriota bacterium]
MIRPLLATILAAGPLLAPLDAHARPDIYPQTPDAGRMKADVYTLASPAFEGRLTGTPGQMKAAHLVADRFRTLGLQPLGAGAEPFFLPYELALRATDESASSLSLNGHRAAFGPGAASYRLAPLSVELDFLPEGALPGAAERDHWIAAFAPKGFKAEDAGPMLAKLLDRGAAGLVLLPRPGVDELAPLRGRARAFSTRGRYGFPEEATPTGPPEAILDEPSASALGLDLAALMTRRDPLALGTLRLDPARAAQMIHPVNVAGLLPGTDPKLKDEIVVLSAHEDHLGIVNGELHPGADDNASGTAVLMEVARLIKDAKPRRSILFLSVSGEELGLFGSRAFVAKPPVPLQAIVADLNTDMVGRNGVKTIAITPARVAGATGTLTRDAREIADALGFTLTAEADDYWKRSDHYTFAQVGIPALFFFGGMEPDYHQATDTPDKVEPEKLANVAEMLRRLALKVANADARPRPLPDQTWKSWAWPSR